VKIARFRSLYPAVALVICLLLLALTSACNKSAGGVKPFKDEASWDFAKKQRWQQMQQAINTDATPVSGQHRRVAISRIMIRGWTVDRLQQYFDSMEQKRTGDSTARSCRKADANKGYDISACTPGQLAAEFFFEEEEHFGD